MEEKNLHMSNAMRQSFSGEDSPVNMTIAHGIPASIRCLV